MVRGRARLGALRGNLLDGLLASLRADPGVQGVALVGSLGSGTGDEWSDLDLLLVVSEQDVARFATYPVGMAWANADLLVDARHNAPSGAMSAATIHLREGLPLRVDWYMYPHSLGAWPSDSRVLYQIRPIIQTPDTFAAFNSRGPRQPAVPKTSDEVRIAHLSMVPIAGKYVARRSPSAAPMIEFLSGALSPDLDPTGQLRQLRTVAESLSRPEDQWLAEPVRAYLDIVEEDLQ